MSNSGRRQIRTRFSRLSAFAGDRRGNVAITFSLALPVLLAAGGAAIDFLLASHQKTQLQSAADAGALAGAKELTLGGQSYNAAGSSATNVAVSVAQSHMQKAAGKQIDVTAALTQDKSGVEVIIRQKAEAYFTRLLSATPADIQVKAVAKAQGTTKICVLGLDESGGHVVSLDSNARLTATNCGVYSNSKSGKGLRSESNAVLRAQMICTAGGKVGGKGNFYPTPITDCPQIKDPLASRPPPPVGPCTATGLIIKDVVRTLTPGTYCDGLTIDGNAKVRVQPGIYVIKDGPLIVDSNAELDGDYVGFFFTGKKSYFRFTSNAKVNLGAPKDGPMAGLLFFEDRNNTEQQKFHILSDYTRRLLGTIYLPRGRFYIDANNPVADQSAYTAIVVRRLELFAGPNLVVNANYEGTDVPVPPGVGPIGGKTRLVQ